MVANMEFDFPFVDVVDLAQPLPQSQRKNHPLIEVGQPFADTGICVRGTPCEKYAWLPNLRIDPGLAKTSSQHVRKALHALLVIGRVISDQYYPHIIRLHVLVWYEQQLALALQG